MPTDETAPHLESSSRAIEDRLKTLNAEMKDLSENAEVINRESRQLLGALSKERLQPPGFDTTSRQLP